jgi:nitrous oxide reductase
MKTTRLTNRRKFLLAAGLGSAAVAGAVAANGRKAATGPQAAAEPAKPTGYHVTEHIQKYYKTTEV